MSDNSTPEKYRAKPRNHEQKDWLYQRYWGELLSTQAIADEEGVSKYAVQKGLEMNGIPRRSNGWTMDNTVSAFDGFYGDDESNTVDRESMDFDGVNEANDEWKKPDGRLNWQRAARRDSAISEKAVLNNDGDNAAKTGATGD